MLTHTYDEYLMWMEWLDEQWNNPGLTEQYLMQVAAEVRRVLAKDAKSIRLGHFKLKFTRKEATKQDPKLVKENAVKQQLTTWVGFLGLKANGILDKVMGNPVGGEEELEENE